MPQSAFVYPKDRSWAADVLKELARGPKIAAELKPANPTNTRKQLIILYLNANYQDSMRILMAKGLRPLTYKEAFARSAELIEKLAGKWFWLAGEGKDLKEDGVYKFDARGNLKELKGGETPDQKVRVHSGNKPLSLNVGYYSMVNNRFNLVAGHRHYVVAPAIVGTQT